MDHQEDSGVKRRAACEECRNKKLKCSGTQPACTRCAHEGITCFYSLQKTMGRPKKRARSTGNDHNLQDRTTRRKSPHITTTTWDSTIMPHEQEQDPSNTHDMDSYAPDFTPEDFIQPWLSPPESTSIPLPALTSSTTSPSPPESNLNIHLSPTHSHPPLITTCACLSTLYLTLSTLNTMQNPNHCTFPAALQPLRAAMHTAHSVLICEECPKSFTTGLQNASMLGTLFVSIAERFSKVLEGIHEEAGRAEREGEGKRLRVVDEEDGLGWEAFGLEVSPREWEGLCKRVVRVEVEGPLSSSSSYSSSSSLASSSSSSPSGGGEGGGGEDRPLYFLRLVELMEERQLRWHQMPLPVDMPKGAEGVFRSHGGRCESGKKEELHCLKLVGGSRRLVTGFDWS